MGFHAATCFSGVGWGYTPEQINEIPVGTIRKFGNTGWDERFYWNEGDRVRKLKAEGKRVLGTFTVGDNSQWATMLDEDWRRKVALYMANLSIRGVEVGNEIGASQVPAYLSKLAIASEVIRGAGGWVMLSSPWPTAEAKVWDQVQRFGAWDLVDAVACHPYAVDPVRSLDKIKEFRERLKGYGGRAARLHLHATEFGWGTLGGYYQVDELTQALYLTQAFNLFRTNAEALKLNVCMWYTLRDTEGLPGGDPHGCGVIRLDGSHKPSYNAMATL